MAMPGHQEVKEIFNAALRHPPADRIEFLHQACSDDVSLRKEVESLISSYDDAAGFLETPVVAEVSESLIPRKPLLSNKQQFGQYRIIEQIGAGGMGEVYLAREKKLNRKVALKLLPAKLIRDRENLERFEQEAFAVSSLNHPNILTIYAIGEHENTHFISTEYVEGVPLNEHCAQKGPLGLAEILDIGIQISSALELAHKAGIVHRDIKPENIMVRDDGLIKILDFGLAKLTDKHKTIDGDTIPPADWIVKTGKGMIMGTAPYMSPEQAKGINIDERTDIWSLGVVLYELAVEERPFTGETPTDVIANIIHEDPPPINGRFAVSIPEFESVLRKSLLKARDERYRSAGVFRKDLEDLKHKIEFEAELERSDPPDRNTAEVKKATRTLSAQYLFNHIKKHQYAAFLIVPMLLIGFLALGNYIPLNNKPAVLTDKDAILLTDFENETGERIFDGTLKQGLHMQLGQSPFLSIFPEAEINKTLELMKRDPAEHLTPQLGREICLRKGLKAYIVGKISKLGSVYLVGLEAVNSRTGEKIAISQAEAGGKEKVIGALSEAATELRENLGEPLASIREFDKPLPDVTTKSLDALQAYSMAEEMRDIRNKTAAIALYKKAIEIDPEFASAYIDLGDMYDLVRLDLQKEAYMKAFELRDKLSEREKLELDEIYALFIEKDRYKMIDLLKIGKLKYPRDEEVRVGLVRGYYLTGQYEKVIREAKEVIEINPKARYYIGYLPLAYMNLNRFDEAKEAVWAYGQDLDSFNDPLFRIAFVQNDTEAMQRESDQAKEQGIEYLAIVYQAGAALYEGQWRKAMDLSSRADDLVERTGADSFWLKKGQLGLAAESAYLGKCDSAIKDANRLLALPLHRKGRRIPQLLARCGDFARARDLMNEIAEDEPDYDSSQLSMSEVNAQIALQKGNPEEAVELLEKTRRFEFADHYLPKFIRGQAYLKLHQNKKAREEFQSILDHRGGDVFSVLYPLAQLGKARASEDKREYEKFFEMWKNSDQDLPALINARREYVKLK